MRKGLRLFLIVFLIFCCFSLQGNSGRKKDEITFQNGRALSLRVLQKTLANRPLGKPRSLELTQLGYITRIRGYVIDTTTQDIILVGDSIPFDQPLNLDDFVVALRNVWDIYTERKGNAQIYSYPGCSIDPDPKVLKRLQSLENLISSAETESETKKRIDDWCDYCRKPQQVRVMGVPFKSRFAKVMVLADYDMKKLVDGSESTLNVAGFKSLSDMTLDAIQPALIKRKPIAIHISTLNRFWFYPGEVSYLTDEQAGIITQCPVKLLTEEEYLEMSGNTQGKGRGDSLALLFCENFADHYAEISKQKPIYAELESLFRLVALTKLMREQKCTEVAGLDLNYLLNQYLIPSYKVSQTLPGRSSVKEFSHKEEHDGGYNQLYFWLQSCGGVSIEINPPPKQKTDSKVKALLLDLGIDVLNGRENVNQASWSFPSRSKSWLDEWNQFLASIDILGIKLGPGY